MLGEALARHPNITELDLSKNFFQGGGYAQRLSPFEACAVYVYACGPKTVPVKRTFLNIAIVGWSGVGCGGHVNVPCTSYLIYCHAAEISGMVYYVTCCYAADGVGWGGGAC